MERKFTEFPLELSVPVNAPVMLLVNDAHHRLIATVTYDRPLLPTRQHRAEIRLSAPSRLETRAAVGDRSPRYLCVRHFAWIDSKVSYGQLPKWDRGLDALVPADDPTLEVFEDGDLLIRRKMTPWCLGYGWGAGFFLPATKACNGHISIKVSHDTGELFGVLVSTVDLLTPNEEYVAETTLAREKEQ